MNMKAIAACGTSSVRKEAFGGQLRLVVAWVALVFSQGAVARGGSLLSCIKYEVYPESRQKVCVRLLKMRSFGKHWFEFRGARLDS